MRETLNERIRMLRREKGLTQLQLSEQLNVTDKAVSKWEVGEGNPDISLLPKIAEIFDVTIDYLLTGVLPTETVSLEDMDEAKRGVYLTQRDDADNFVKFGYNKTNQLLTLPRDHRYRQSENDRQIREEIYKLESVKIFELLLDDLIKNYDHNRYFNGAKSPAILVYDDVDNFIKMCAITNRIDGLEFIQFPIFAVGSKANQDRRRHYGQREPNSTYLIEEKTLRFIFEDKRISEELIKYVSKMHFYNRDNPPKSRYFYFLNETIINLLYEYERFDLLQENLNELYNNIKYAIEKYRDESVGGRSWYTHKYVGEGKYYTLANGSQSEHHHVVAVVEPILLALNSAKKSLDITWIEKFNNYNKEISAKLSDTVNYINDKDMEILKMKANPEINNYQILVFKNTHLGLLNINKLFNELMPKGDGAQPYKDLLKDIKVINENFVKKSYIHYAEMIEDLINKKDYGSLFKFAVDNDLNGLIDLLMKKKYSEVINLSKRMFYINYEDEEIERWIYSYKRTYKHKTHAEVMVDWFSEQYYKDNENEYNQKYNDLINNQFEISNFEEVLTTNFSDFASSVKNKKVTEIKKTLEDKIEEITGEQKAKAEHDALMAEITVAYLESLITSGQFELAVIKLSVKLESKLRYLYRLEGDLKDMLDIYIKTNLKLDNLYDDEDNDYYSSKERDRLKTEQTTLLNRLRMVRNSIAHPEKKVDMLSKEELDSLVNIVENLKEVSK